MPLLPLLVFDLLTLLVLDLLTLLTLLLFLLLVLLATAVIECIVVSHTARAHLTHSRHFFEEQRAGRAASGISHNR